jgi:peptidylprolyl isomerase
MLLLARDRAPFLLRSPPLLLTALLVAGVACRARAAEVLARVGGTEVTVEEVKAYVETLPARDQAALARDPGLLSQVVRSYLTRQAVLREAQAKRFDQQPGVKAQLDRARDQALTDLFLDSVSRPTDAFPSDAELQAAYAANRATFEIPRQFRVAQIYVALPKGADKGAEDQAHKKLDEVVKKLKAKGADFAALARTDSDDAPTAAQGGEIGWLTEAQMIPGIRATATALAKDAVSEPVRLDDGWHVLKLLETRAAGVRPLAEVRDALAEQLRVARARELRQAYVAKLLEQSPPAINELALSRVVQKPK